MKFKANIATVAICAGLVAFGGGAGAYAATAINGDTIVDNTLDGGEIQNESLTGADVDNGTLTGDDIRNGTVGPADVAGLGSADFADGGVRGVDILNGTIGSADLADASIQSEDLAPGVQDTVAQMVQDTLGTSAVGDVYATGTFDQASVPDAPEIVPTFTLSGKSLVIIRVTTKTNDPVRVTLTLNGEKVAQCVAIPAGGFEGTCSDTNVFSQAGTPTLTLEGGNAKVEAFAVNLKGE